ncbi:MAG: VF530 family protein [Verrucomicrobia bacterium]|nr:VF530 family protein [Verrucomicrobiota bacterium]
MPDPQLHPRDPLHGLTLEAILRQLVERHGWEELGRWIPVRCLLYDPSIKSSLTFLRKTPWARTKIESWFTAEADQYPSPTPTIVRSPTPPVSPTKSTDLPTPHKP